MKNKFNRILSLFLCVCVLVCVCVACGKNTEQSTSNTEASTSASSTTNNATVAPGAAINKYGKILILKFDDALEAHVPVYSSDKDELKASFDAVSANDSYTEVLVSIFFEKEYADEIKSLVDTNKIDGVASSQVTATSIALTISLDKFDIDDVEAWAGNENIKLISLQCLPEAGA